MKLTPGCRLVNTNISVYCTNPGIAATSLNLFMPGPINQAYAALSKGWTLTVPQVLQIAIAGCLEGLHKTPACCYGESCHPPHQ